MLKQNVRSVGHPFPYSNADVCIIEQADQQRNRSLSLKPKFTWKRRLLPGNGVRCPST